MASTVGRYVVTSITTLNIIMVPVAGIDGTRDDVGSEITQVRLQFGAANADQLTEYAVGRQFEVTVNRL